MRSHSREFFGRSAPATEVKVINEDGTMVLANGDQGKHPNYQRRRLLWDAHLPPFTVGRTGKISFRRVGQKVTPKGSSPDYGYKDDEDMHTWGVKGWSGGDPDEPSIRGNHEIHQDFEQRYAKIRVKI